MGTSQIMKKCAECNKSTMHYQEKPNHILHLLLSIVTAGIWLIVWILFIQAKNLIFLLRKMMILSSS